MNAASRLLQWLAGLFVDDGALAVSAVLWLLATALLLPLLVAPGWRGPLLFAGLAMLLADSVRRA